MFNCFIVFIVLLLLVLWLSTRSQQNRTAPIPKSSSPLYGTVLSYHVVHKSGKIVEDNNEQGKSETVYWFTSDRYHPLLAQYGRGDKVEFDAYGDEARNVFVYEPADKNLDWLWCDGCNRYLRCREVHRSVKVSDWDNDFLDCKCMQCGGRVENIAPKKFRQIYDMYKYHLITVTVQQDFEDILKSHDSDAMVKFLEQYKPNGREDQG